MPTELVETIVEQVPALVVLVWITARFLRALGQRDETINCFAEKHVEAMKENTRALTEVRVYLERVNGKESKKR